MLILATSHMVTTFKNSLRTLNINIDNRIEELINSVVSSIIVEYTAFDELSELNDRITEELMLELSAVDLVKINDAMHCLGIDLKNYLLEMKIYNNEGFLDYEYGGILNNDVWLVRDK